jgi:hypothetical protein
MRLCGRPCPCGRWAASARMHPSVRANMGASARTRLVLPQVTLKRMLQCVQVTDAPEGMVRSFVEKRPRDNHGYRPLPDEPKPAEAQAPTATRLHRQ